ncbi:MAG: hypothetical protein FWE45_05210 [Firmicutes bacterium]|nr:hypothetical protein [Bacillota bacterium]
MFDSQEEFDIQEALNAKGWKVTKAYAMGFWRVEKGEEQYNVDTFDELKELAETLPDMSKVASPAEKSPESSI